MREVDNYRDDNDMHMLCFFFRKYILTLMIIYISNAFQNVFEIKTLF